MYITKTSFHISENRFQDTVKAMEIKIAAKTIDTINEIVRLSLRAFTGRTSNNVASTLYMQESVINQ